MNKLNILSDKHPSAVEYIKQAVRLGNLVLIILKYSIIITSVLAFLAALIVLFSSGEGLIALLILLSPFVTNFSLFVLYVHIKQKNALILINAIQNDEVKIS